MKEGVVEDLIKIMPLMHRKFFKNLRKQDFKKYTMALMSIYEHDGKPMTFYCEKLVISKPNFTKIVNELIELDFVERKEDEKDRRKINMFITEKGKIEVKLKKKEVVELVSKGLESISKEDLDELHSHVVGIHTILNKL